MQTSQLSGLSERDAGFLCVLHPCGREECSIMKCVVLTVHNKDHNYHSQTLCKWSETQSFVTVVTTSADTSSRAM